MSVKQEHIPVFYDGQDDLVDILATSMASVCYNTKSFIEFYILDCGIHELNKNMLEDLKKKFNNCSIEFIPIDLSQFAGLKGYTKGNFLDCYSRLLIPELKPNLDKAIYLDTDTIVLKDIERLWNENLDGKSLGCIPDLGYCQVIKQRFVNELNGDANQLYISGGVWVANCKKWRENNITQQLLDLAKDKKDKLCFIIEDLFSLFFKADYKLLDCRYAFIEMKHHPEEIPVEKITAKYLADELKNVVILHLAGVNKIWKNPYNIYTNRIHSYFNCFWYFAKMTSFYEGMQNKYIYFVSKSAVIPPKKIKIKIFDLLTVMSIKNKDNAKRYYLFGFIPLFKIKF